MKKIVNLEGVEVTYNEFEGTSPAAILVHGAGANRNYWKALCEALLGRTPLCPDLYGQCWHHSHCAQCSFTESRHTRKGVFSVKNSDPSRLWESNPVSL